MAELVTTLGRKRADEIGMMLPHEHIFVDLRTPDQPGYAEGNPADVVALMQPEIEKIKAQGMTAIVECSCVGVGRRADCDLAVSVAANFPVLVPTGIYREQWIPDWVRAASEDEIYEWMLSELNGDIDGTGVQAGWIKLGASDAGLTPDEIKNLKAAARASKATGALIGIHTISGAVARHELDIIEANGGDASRYVWIHTQAEDDFAIHLEMARRGTWIEYDNIGGSADEVHIERILKVLDAGFGDQLLLSHDRGWYDPALPNGGTPQPYTVLVETFLPKLRAAGVDEAMVWKLTAENPFRAFAR